MMVKSVLQSRSLDHLLECQSRLGTPSWVAFVLLDIRPDSSGIIGLLCHVNSSCFVLDCANHLADNRHTVLHQVSVVAVDDSVGVVCACVHAVNAD